MSRADIEETDDPYIRMTMIRIHDMMVAWWWLAGSLSERKLVSALLRLCVPVHIEAHQDTRQAARR